MPIRRSRFSKVRPISFILSLTGFFAIAAAAGPSPELTTLQVGFRKYHRRPDTTQVLSGTIYYQRRNFLIIRVQEPVNQWLEVRNAECAFYYPDDNWAFRFLSDQPIVLPVVELFLSAVDPDFGLTALGYVLAETGKKGDTLTMVWTTGPALSADAPRYRVSVTGRKLVAAVWETSAGAVLVRSWFYDHREHNRVFFPLGVTSEAIEAGDTLRDEIVYTDPGFDRPLPDSILRFKIPADARVDTVRW